MAWPLCNNVTYKSVRGGIIGTTVLSHTNVEESAKIVVLSLAYASLLEQAKNSGITQSGFVNLERLDVVNTMLG
jgi:hypothetical protein